MQVHTNKLYASDGTGTGTAGTTNFQGYNGGTCPSVSNSPAGGGGGAGGAGENASNGFVGAGGVGVQCSITGTSTYYAGGGGGGSYGLGGKPGGLGGSGTGAGSGTTASYATNGTNSLGGGGGGQSAASGSSGNGGSGVLIIKYSNTNPQAASTTGSPTYTETGGYHIYKFTGSGSITF